MNKFKNEKLKFDIIFLDPPYRLNIIEEILDFIKENNMLNEKGIIVCQYVRGNYTPNETEELAIIKKNSEFRCFFVLSHTILKVFFWDNF